MNKIIQTGANSIERIENIQGEFEVIILSKMNLFKVKKLTPNFRIYKLLFLDCTQKFKQNYNLF